MKTKITILVDEGSLMYAPSAYIEVRYAQPMGGICARGGAYHVSPRLAYPRLADDNFICFGKTKKELIEKINSRFPDDRYIKEYV